MLAGYFGVTSRFCKKRERDLVSRTSFYLWFFLWKERLRWQIVREGKRGEHIPVLNTGCLTSES